jgi:hypothetical protein
VRQLAPMPAAAAANLGAEMRANLLALNEILSLVAAGKLKEAGELAEKELGIPAMGQTSRSAFRRASRAAHAAGDARDRHRRAQGGERVCPYRRQR